MHPLISIIIPIYNVEAYLERCINSVINQTYQNVEIILVDDGSPDGSPSICDKYAKKDKRIVVIHKKNGGLSEARNAGTEIANGQYLYYLDADDEIPKDAIHLMEKQIEAHPSVEIVIGQMQSFPYTKTYETAFLNNFDYIDSNQWVRKQFYRIQNRLPVNACNKLILKKFISQNHFFFEPGLIHEDELWMFSIAQKLCRIAFVHHITYIRYINPNSITTATSLSKKRQAWDHIFSKVFVSITDPCANEQFFTYLSLWMKFYTPPKNETTPNKSIWENIILFSQRKKFFFLEKLLKLYKFSFPIIKGHGIGFLIWLYSKTAVKN